MEIRRNFFIQLNSLEENVGQPKFGVNIQHWENKNLIKEGDLTELVV